MKSRWYSGRWLARLGVVGEPQPEVIPAFSPVIAIGDHSELFAPLPPASAWFSGLTLPGGAVFGTFEVHSRAAGGTYVSIALQMNTLTSPPTVNQMLVAMTTDPVAIAAQTQVASTNLFLAPESVMLVSVEAAALTVPPAVRVAVQNRLLMVPVFYIPPGQRLTIQGQVNTAFWCSCVLRDVEVAQPDPIV